MWDLGEMMDLIVVKVVDRLRFVSVEAGFVDFFHFILIISWLRLMVSCNWGVFESWYLVYGQGLLLHLHSLFFFFSLVTLRITLCVNMFEILSVNDLLRKHAIRVNMIFCVNHVLCVSITRKTRVFRLSRTLRITCPNYV